MLENWHISDFHVSDARPSQEDGFAEHLSTRGENLPLVANFLFEHHRPAFDRILKPCGSGCRACRWSSRARPRMGGWCCASRTAASRTPFIARHVSDGTIKMFAYLVLLNDPKPYPLLAVEEPENQLYPELLPPLAEEFRDYARRGGQVFISTHSPDFLNALTLEEIFCLRKDGVSARCAALLTPRTCVLCSTRVTCRVTCGSRVCSRASTDAGAARLPAGRAVDEVPARRLAAEADARLGGGPALSVRAA